MDIESFIKDKVGRTKRPARNVDYGNTAEATKLGSVGYLAPVFSPAIGGGVIYLELLANALLDRAHCERFVILTEAFPGRSRREVRGGGRLEILRHYPFRAGRNRKSIWSYVAYVWQNCQFLWLPVIARRKAIDTLLIHGSFLNNPTSLWFIVRLLRRLRPEMLIVADLRDPKLPLSTVPRLSAFDRIICCSENIVKRLGDRRDLRQKVVEIPIVIAETRPMDGQIDRTKERYGLGKLTYVFNGSGLKREKGTEQLVQLVQWLRTQGHNVVLAVSGKRRYWGTKLEQARKEGWFYYLGQVPHEDVVALAAGSWLDVNLSEVDSMPRHSLEAMSVGASVLLPKGVPEFNRDCPAHVAAGTSREALGRQALSIAKGEAGPCSYPMRRHSLDEVITQYIDALRE